MELLYPFRARRAQNVRFELLHNLYILFNSFLPHPYKIGIENYPRPSLPQKGNMRSIWSGSLSFGLVNIPVRLYVATQENRMDMDMLHKKDMSPIRFARVCEREEKEVTYDQIIKGVEVNESDYVVLTEEEIAKANVKKTKTIEIQQFVKETDIDTIYFEKPYYIEPAKGAEKSFALLYEALKKAKKVGIAKFVLRTRERVAVIKPYKNTLLVNQLRYFREIRTTDELRIPKQPEITEKEVDMALAFISQLTEDFDPKQFTDTYTNELKALVEAKAKGKVVSVSDQEPVPTKVNDLMSLLKQSLEQERGRATGLAN